MKLLFSFLLPLVLLACKKEESSSETTEIASSAISASIDESYETIGNSISIGETFPDGTYCAEVEYYNPTTGTRNSYELDVEVENGDLVQIDWPNGGWLDSTHFTPESISTGEVSFTSDKGYHYTVTLESYGGGCYDGVYELRNALNNEIAMQEERETCLNCGGFKFTYDEICSSCERKIEDEEKYTCPQCGGRKFSTFDDVCYDCKRSNESE